MKSLFNLIIFAILFSACVRDNIEDLKKASIPNPVDSTPVTVPVIVCDSSVISFSAKIKPLLESKCGSKDIACHITGAVDGSTQLDNYAGVKRVAANGKLKSAITWDGNASQMPDKQPKLDDCTIYLITSWIDQGMKNN